ncbi:MAG TPA: hypothetical protein VK166_14510 [Chitinophagaceae bacterium]|nr:hypothetical protein [Chitinophagaceae bacterium]
MIFPIMILVFTGCGTLQKATMHGLSDGYYKLSLPGRPAEKVYAVVTEDSITTYGVVGKDSLSKDPGAILWLNPNPEHAATTNFLLQKSGMDFDITTVLFKYRFKTQALPPQLNANLNLAGYVGYKKEYFRFRDLTKPDKQHKTDLNHYTIDAGIFTGFGSTPINPSTTAGHLQTEYDGFIWQNGAAVFVGWGIFTFGIGLGFDTLLDSNRSNWIYNGKPWTGIIIGLTLAN